MGRYKKWEGTESWECIDGKVLKDGNVLIGRY